MVTASRNQNMVQINKKNACLATIVFFSFVALGLESPRGGGIPNIELATLTLGTKVDPSSRELLSTLTAA